MNARDSGLSISQMNPKELAAKAREQLFAAIDQVNSDCGCIEYHLPTDERVESIIQACIEKALDQEKTPWWPRNTQSRAAASPVTVSNAESSFNNPDPLDERPNP